MSKILQEYTQVWVAHALTGSAIAAFSLLVWDILISFDDEVERIWCGSKSRVIRYLFLFMRYFGLVVHLIRAYFGFHIASLGTTGTHSLCRGWYIFEMITMEVSLAAVGVLLMIRVYALYDRNNQLAVVMAILLFIELASMGGFTWHLLSGLFFGDVCLIYMDLDDTLFFFLVALFSQSFVWLFAMFKCYMSIVAGWGRTPLVYLIIRDSICVFSALFAVMLINIVLSRAVSYALITIINPWLVTLMSLSGCRIIINMDRFSQQSLQRTTNVELSTFVVPTIVEPVMNDGTSDEQSSPAHSTLHVSLER